VRHSFPIGHIIEATRRPSQWLNVAERRHCSRARALYPSSPWCRRVVGATGEQAARTAQLWSIRLMGACHNSLCAKSAGSRTPKRFEVPRTTSVTSALMGRVGRAVAT